MAETTGIAWAKSTFNPWIGCTRVSPGCDVCYAEALDRRHRWGGKVHWGAGVERMRTRPANWNKLVKWNREAPSSSFAGRLGFWPVFCASLADFADNEVPSSWREDLAALIDATPNLSYLLVTKRIGNVWKLYPRWASFGIPRHVRIIASIVNQEEADRDLPKLRALGCRNGVSYEPALGPVHWWPWLVPGGIEWLIVGGESAQGGAKARPFQISWAQTAVDQCRAAGVPVFVKQLGSMVMRGDQPGDRVHFVDRSGATPAEWPIDLRVQEFPR